jgi:hypothetical protein
MNRPLEEAAATPDRYVEHALEVNAIAREALRLRTRDARPIAAKISLGLSLQAAELAGKAILRALGHTVEQIRKDHGRHDLLTLLRSVETELRAHQNANLGPFHHFLLWTPTIDGQEFGSTIGAYLELHFARGASAFPRSYFYPDEPVFTGPVPIQALCVMVDHIVEVSRNVVETLRQQP